MVCFSGCMSDTPAWVIHCEAYPSSPSSNTISSSDLPQPADVPFAPFWFCPRCRQCAQAGSFQSTQQLMPASNTPWEHVQHLASRHTTAGRYRGTALRGRNPAQCGITEVQASSGIHAGSSAARTITPNKRQDDQYLAEWLSLERVACQAVYFSSLCFSPFLYSFSLPSPSDSVGGGSKNLKGLLCKYLELQARHKDETNCSFYAGFS